MNGRIYDPTIGRMISPDNYVPMPWSTQGYNRYGYANNNPLSYNDPNGEFLNFLIGGLIGGVINVVSGIITGKIHNFGDGLKYFAVGAVAGALGAGIANGLSASIMNAGSFGSGFIGAVNAVPIGFGNGFVVDAASGFAGGFVGGAGNALIEGQGFGKALGSGLKAGGLGALTGGVAGGVVGGINATKVGRNFWNGQMVVETKPLGDYVGYSSDAGQGNLADCGPKSVSKMDQEAFGGNLQQSDVRGWQGGDPNATGLKDVDMWTQYAHDYGKELAREPFNTFTPQSIAEHVGNGYKAAFSISSAGQGHEVLLNGISSQIISRANGSLFMRYVFNIYDPSLGRLINYYKPFNVLNTFYLR